ncbi:MAG: Gfo/Idh/MocA family oxidoreductase [Armatimonadetes bacterium]|nr:Gfo/Idh/MocA family oxidoreductase [Armatimonadota bacterium]
MKDIGVGVIGLGMGMDLFLLHDDPKSRFEVRGICSATPEKVRHVAEERGVRFSTTDFNELVAREDLEVIAVYSPDHLHGEHCIAALQAGKHVVCTKPLVGRQRGAGVMLECEQIVQLAREKDCRFLVGQTMRFDPEFRAAKTLLDEGDLGRVLFAEAHYVHDLRGIGELTPWRVTAPQDLMFGGACHPIDLLRWFLGDVEEISVYASGINPPYPIEDNFLINLRFANGVIARILAAYGLVHPPMPMMGLSLYGTKASIQCDYHDFKGGNVNIVFDKLEGQPTLSTHFDAVMEGAYGHGKAVRQYMSHFEDCLVNGKAPSPNAVDGARTIAVGCAGWESIRTGQPARVRNDF